MKHIKKFDSFVNESTDIKDSISQWEKAIKDGSVQSYIDSGADPNFENGVPLRLAAGSGNLEMAKVLVENGADPTLRRYMPLKWAANCGNAEILIYLINSIKSKLDDKQMETLKSDVIFWLETGLDTAIKNIDMKSAISKIKNI